MGLDLFFHKTKEALTPCESDPVGVYVDYVHDGHKYPELFRLRENYDLFELIFADYLAQGGTSMDFNMVNYECTHMADSIIEMCVAVINDPDNDARCKPSYINFIFELGKAIKDGYKIIFYGWY